MRYGLWAAARAPDGATGIDTVTSDAGGKVAVKEPAVVNTENTGKTGNSGSEVVTEPVKAAAEGAGKEAAKPATIADGEVAAAKEGAADFPADWREKMAGSDAKALAKMQRYATPAAYAKANIELEREFSKRPVPVTHPGDKATPEQIAEYRKAAGLPVEADDYLKNIKIADGRTLGDADKAIAAQFAKDVGMSGAPLTQAQFDAAVSWQLRQQEIASDDLAKADASRWAANQETLRQEMGADYAPNMNLVKSMLSGVSEDFQLKLLTARLPDGTKLGGDVETLKWLAGMAREATPLATIVPASGQTALQTVDARISTIEKAMQVDGGREYWKSATMQSEYRDLLTAREKHKARGKAA